MSSEQTDLVYEYMAKKGKYLRQVKKRETSNRFIQTKNEFNEMYNTLKKKRGYISKFTTYLCSSGLYSTKEIARKSISFFGTTYGCKTNDEKKEKILSMYQEWRRNNPEEDRMLRVSNKNCNKKNIEKHVNALNDYWISKGLK